MGSTSENEIVDPDKSYPVPGHEIGKFNCSRREPEKANETFRNPTRGKSLSNCLLLDIHEGDASIASIDTCEESLAIVQNAILFQVSFCRPTCEWIF
jgi:hypothetical protein